jgi:3-deoxy-D-manno-octulosonic-acid transferase
MRIAYYLITTVCYFLLYPYLYYRILKKKECPLRYQEKLGVSLKSRNNGYLIWFHCSSIGELKSIFPIIDHYLKKNQILVTILYTNTHLSTVLKLLKNFLQNGTLI